MADLCEQLVLSLSCPAFGQDLGVGCREKGAGTQTTRLEAAHFLSRPLLGLIADYASALF